MRTITWKKYKQPTEGDSYSHYYHAVSQTKILDPKTERELLKTFRETGDLKSRDRLIESCLRFVVTLANRFTSDSDKLKDLISAGNFGLLKALDHYEENYNTRFLSYATYWVLLYMRNELSNCNLISMPLWYQKTMRKLNKMRVHTMTCTGHRPTDDELCGAGGITKEQLSNFRVEHFRFSSVEDCRLSNDGIELRAMSAETKDLLKELLQSRDAPFSTKERFIIGAYYGFVTDSWPLEKIGNYLGLSSERVRQVKEVAMKRLRRILRNKYEIRETLDSCPE